MILSFVDACSQDLKTSRGLHDEMRKAASSNVKQVMLQTLASLWFRFSSHTFVITFFCCRSLIGYWRRPQNNKDDNKSGWLEEFGSKRQFSVVSLFLFF